MLDNFGYPPSFQLLYGGKTGIHNAPLKGRIRFAHRYANLNPTQGFAGQKSEKDRVLAFKNTLESHGIPCTVRMRRGIDIQAGCGQLASKNK